MIRALVSTRKFDILERDVRKPNKIDIGYYFVLWNNDENKFYIHFKKIFRICRFAVPEHDDDGPGA